jgi:hypothetical protein
MYRLAIAAWLCPRTCGSSIDRHIRAERERMGSRASLRVVERWPTEMPVHLYFATDAVRTEAAHGVPNGLGIEIATKSLVRRLAHLFGGGYTDLGDAAFDKSFVVRTTDVDRAAGGSRPTRDGGCSSSPMPACIRASTRDGEDLALHEHRLRARRATEFDLRATARVARLLTADRL